MNYAEKAKELVEKFKAIIVTHSIAKKNERSKQCAIICVDEIWKALKPHDDLPEINAHYWNSVKSEIEKL